MDEFGELGREKTETIFVAKSRNQERQIGIFEQVTRRWKEKTEVLRQRNAKRTEREKDGRTDASAAVIVAHVKWSIILFILLCSSITLTVLAFHPQPFRFCLHHHLLLCHGRERCNHAATKSRQR